jgi:O-antigen/teichoic acid export membrane protein
MFFALGLSGLLQSRIDLYSVNAFLSRGDVGRYQVFSNFVLYVQSFAAFMLLPFAAGLYRLTYRAILKLSIRLLSIGALLIGPALLAVYLLITRVYHFDLPPACWLLAIALVLPIYAYSPIIHALFKAGRQATVVKVGLLGAAFNLVLNLVWTPRLEIVGALMAATAAQLMTLGAYLVQARSLEARDAPVVSGLPFADGS